MGNDRPQKNIKNEVRHTTKNRGHRCTFMRSTHFSLINLNIDQYNAQATNNTPV